MKSFLGDVATAGVGAGDAAVDGGRAVVADGGLLGQLKVSLNLNKIHLPCSTPFVKRNGGSQQEP